MTIDQVLPPLAIEKFDLHIEQCASDESVRHSCRNDAYFEILIHSLLNLQYFFDFDEEFNDFLSTLEDNLDVKLEVSFDVICFFEFKFHRIILSSMTSMSSSIELSLFICCITKIYNNFSIFCNKYKGIPVIEYYNRLDTQLDFDHEIKNAKQKE
jgi:hypothetical protein